MPQDMIQRGAQCRSTEDPPYSLERMRYEIEALENPRMGVEIIEGRQNFQSFAVGLGELNSQNPVFENFKLVSKPSGAGARKKYGLVCQASLMV